jgi:actin-like ATPase involved in cell morphogenesis
VNAGELIGAEEIRRAIGEPLAVIIDAVKTTLDKCPPELAGEGCLLLLVSASV